MELPELLNVVGFRRAWRIDVSGSRPLAVQTAASILQETVCGTLRRAGRASLWRATLAEDAIYCAAFVRLQRIPGEGLTTTVPADFPKDVTPALLAGSTPKLSGRMINGKFVVGLTADECYQR